MKNWRHWYEDEVTQTLVKKKYAAEDENTFEDVVIRVASIYSDSIREKVRKNMLEGNLTPAGRTLAGAGVENQNLTISNCYILGNVEDDSLEAISKIDYEVSRIGSMGGGVGLALDKIRPKGSKINNAAKISDGVAFVLRKINQTGKIVGQAGRGLAIMTALRDSHPDIYEILNLKNNDEDLRSMNISIKFTDEFMKAVEEGGEYTLYADTPNEHIEKKIKARDFFQKFCETQYDWADPSALFIDKINSYHLLSGYPEYKIEVSNPCAEYMGNRGNACLLQSINLYNCVDDKFTKSAKVNYKKLEELTRLSIRMMNETQEYGYKRQPLDINRENIDNWNSIGLGVLGLADMFIALGIKYGSKRSLDVVSRVFDLINLCALDESANIAKERGTFKKYNWEYTKKSPIIKALLLSPEGKKVYKNIEKNGLANGSLIAEAPTGSISMLLGKCSGGGEPIFKCYYERTTHSMEDGKGEQKSIKIYSRSVEDLLNYHNLPLDMTSEEIKKKFPFVVESHDIEPIDRIAVQSVMQEYVDNAISSTVNLPESATVQDIWDIYVNAWKQGCKGITIFRDNCARGNLLGVTKKEEPYKHPKLDSITPESRRGVEAIDGTTYRMNTACVPKFYVTVNKDEEGNIFEVFSHGATGCQSNRNTITRLVSMALRSGVKVEEIIHELKANNCPACQALQKRGEKVENSCGAVFAKALQKSYKIDVKTKVERKPIEVDKPKEIVSPKRTENNEVVCPECGRVGTIKPEAHCWVCTECGASGCN